MMRQSSNGGLCTMESMACKVANIVPRYSALGEWANGGVVYMEPSDIPYYTPRQVNTRGCLVHPDEAISKLAMLYENSNTRYAVAEAGYKLVSHPQFTWASVGARFKEVLDATYE